MKRTAMWAAGLGLALLLAAPAAEATLVRPFSLRALATEADDVVRGEVEGEEVVYDARWGHVYTHTVVRVDEVLAGRARVGERIVVRQIGGLLDGVESRVVGTATLLPGDEVVLFARTDGALHYLVGMAQGAFHVARAAGAPPTLVREPTGLRLRPVAPPAGPLAPDRLTLDAVRAAVAAVAAEGTR